MRLLFDLRGWEPFVHTVPLTPAGTWNGHPDHKMTLGPSLALAYGQQGPTQAGGRREVLALREPIPRAIGRLGPSGTMFAVCGAAQLNERARRDP